MNTSPKKRTLVVDDESILRMLISEALSEAGYAVDTAENGMYALEQLKKAAKYDLIITDMNMPGMDGISLCRKVRQDFPALKHKFLFLTGYLTDEAMLFFRETGSKYMTKPFKTLDLLKEINTILLEQEVAATEDVLWKTGADRRAEERFSWSAYCDIFDDKTYNQTPLLAKTEDISQNGVKIRYIGEPLAPGDMVSIHIKNLNIQRAAKIMWSKTVNELDSLSGMRLIEPMKMPPSVVKRASL